MGVNAIDLPECLDCHRQVRPRNATAAQFPGTVPQGSPDRCQTCQKRYRKGYGPMGSEERTDRHSPMRVAPKPRSNYYDPTKRIPLTGDRGVDLYIEQRRARGVPPEGLPVEELGFM